MKTISIDDAQRLIVAEATGKDAAGTDCGRAWTFATLADAAAQAEEFAAELAQPEHAGKRAQLDAARAARDAAKEAKP